MWGRYQQLLEDGRGAARLLTGFYVTGKKQAVMGMMTVGPRSVLFVCDMSLQPISKLGGRA